MGAGSALTRLSEKYCQFFILTLLSSYNTLPLVCVMCSQFLFILFGPSVTTLIQHQEHESILYGVICNGGTSLGQPFILFSCLYSRHSPYFVSLFYIMYLCSLSNKSQDKICITWRHNISLFILNWIRKLLPISLCSIMNVWRRRIYKHKMRGLLAIS